MTFVGWSLPGSNVILTDILVNKYNYKNIQLEAHWKGKYNVKFTHDIVEFEDELVLDNFPEDKKVTEGDKTYLYIPSVVAPEDIFVFDAWYDAVTGERVPDYNDVVITEDRTFVAKFTHLTANLTIDYGSSIGRETIAVKKRMPIDPPDEPVIEHYNFYEWEVDEDGDGDFDGVFDFSAGIMEDTTIRAVYEAIMYSVSFDCGDGIILSSDAGFGGQYVSAISPNRQIRLPEEQHLENVPEGQALIGWALSPDATGDDIYNDRMTLPELKNTTIYAIYGMDFKTIKLVLPDGYTSEALKNYVDYDETNGYTKTILYSGEGSSFSLPNFYNVDDLGEFSDPLFWFTGVDGDFAETEDYTKLANDLTFTFESLEQDETTIYLQVKEHNAIIVDFDVPAEIQSSWPRPSNIYYDVSVKTKTGSETGVIQMYYYDEDEGIYYAQSDFAYSHGDNQVGMFEYFPGDFVYLAVLYDDESEILSQLPSDLIFTKNMFKVSFKLLPATVARPTILNPNGDYTYNWDPTIMITYYTEIDFKDYFISGSTTGLEFTGSKQEANDWFSDAGVTFTIEPGLHYVWEDTEDVEPIEITAKFIKFEANPDDYFDVPNMRYTGEALDPTYQIKSGLSTRDQQIAELVLPHLSYQVTKVGNAFQGIEHLTAGDKYTIYAYENHVDCFGITMKRTRYSREVLKMLAEAPTLDGKKVIDNQTYTFTWDPKFCRGYEEILAWNPNGPSQTIISISDYSIDPARFFPTLSTGVTLHKGFSGYMEYCDTDYTINFKLDATTFATSAWENGTDTLTIKFRFDKMVIDPDDYELSATKFERDDRYDEVTGPTLVKKTEGVDYLDSCYGLVRRVVADSEWGTVSGIGSDNEASVPIEAGLYYYAIHVQRNYIVFGQNRETTYGYAFEVAPQKVNFPANLNSYFDLPFEFSLDATTPNGAIINDFAQLVEERCGYIIENCNIYGGVRYEILNLATSRALPCGQIRFYLDEGYQWRMADIETFETNNYDGSTQNRSTLLDGNGYYTKDIVYSYYLNTRFVQYMEASDIEYAINLSLVETGEPQLPTFKYGSYGVELVIDGEPQTEPGEYTAYVKLRFSEDMQWARFEGGNDSIPFTYTITAKPQENIGGGTTTAPQATQPEETKEEELPIAVIAGAIGAVVALGGGATAGIIIKVRKKKRK